MFKKHLALILVLAMLLSVCPAAAFAADDAEFIPIEDGNGTAAGELVFDELTTGDEAENTAGTNEAAIDFLALYAQNGEPISLGFEFTSAFRATVYTPDGLPVEPAGENLWMLCPGYYLYDITAPGYIGLRNEVLDISGEGDVVISLELDRLDPAVDYIRDPQTGAMLMSTVEIPLEDYSFEDELTAPLYDIIYDNPVEVRNAIIEQVKACSSGLYVANISAGGGYDVANAVSCANPYISFKYRLHNYDPNTSFNQFSAALTYQMDKHTGVPDEGDYLARALLCGSGMKGTNGYYDGDDVVFTIQYTPKVTLTPAQVQELNNACASIFDELKLGSSTMSDYDKLLAIHRYLQYNVVYDFEGVKGARPTTDHNPYGALVRGIAVCQGFATSLYRLALMAGIDCRYISSGTMNHGWNIVQCGGQWYYCDATWDENNYYYTGSDNLQYFLKGSSEWLDSHDLGDQYNTNEYAALFDPAAYPVSEHDYVPGSEPEPTVVSGTCGPDVSWILDSEGTLTISGSGPMDPSYSEWGGDFSGTVRYVVIEEGVTSIAAGAFVNCENLTGIELPASLMTIGDYAFMGCTALSDVYYDGYVNAWLALETGIGNEALKNANVSFLYDPADNIVCGMCGDNLGWVVYPDEGFMVFVGSGDMYDYTPGGVPWFEYRDCIEILMYNKKASMTRIGANAFNGFDKLTSVNLTADLVSIGDNAFAGCTGLTGAYYSGTYEQAANLTIGEGNECLTNVFEVVIPTIAGGICGDNVRWQIAGDNWLDIYGTGDMYDYTEGGAPWMQYNSLITGIWVGEEVSSIGSYAFAGLTNVNHVELTNGLSRIGNYAFMGCTGISEAYFQGPEEEFERIEIGTGNECLTDIIVCIIPPIASGECGNNLYWDISYDQWLNISGNGDMYDYAEGEAPWMQYKDRINSIWVAPEVNSIGSYAFAGLENVTQVEFRSGLNRIGEYAFAGCTGLSGAFFHGTTEEFNTIAIGEGNECLTNVLELVIPPIADGDCGEQLCWTINPDYSLSIYGSGSMYDYAPGETPWSIWNDEITAIWVDPGVEAIGANAFNGMSSVIIIVINGSVVRIGDYAFAGCTGISEAFYIGAPESFELIEIGNGNECLTNVLEILLPPIAEGECGSRLHWDIGADNWLHINGVGNMYDYAEGGAPWAEYSELINGIWVGEEVSSIGSYAFAGLANVTQVEFSGSMNRIGDYAFAGCTGLTGAFFHGTAEEFITIAIGEGNECLTDVLEIIEPIIAEGDCGEQLCWTINPDSSLSIYGFGSMYDYAPGEAPWSDWNDAITAIWINSGVLAIGDNAFYGMSSVTDMYVGCDVYRIGENAFAGCSALSDIYYDGYASRWLVMETGSGNEALRNEIVRLKYNPEENIVSGFCGDNLGWDIYLNDGYIQFTGSGDMYDFIPGSAPWFEYRESISSVYYSYNAVVTHIGANAFNGCDMLQTVNLSADLCSIGEDAFAGCSAIETVNYAGGRNAWSGIEIAAGNDYLINTYVAAHPPIELPITGACGDNAVWSIDENGTMTISGTGEIWSDFRSSRIAYENDININALVLEEGITDTGEYAFSGLRLDSLILPDSLKTIGYGTFANCTFRCTVVLPEGLEIIEDRAFQDIWESSFSIVLPSTLKSMGKAVFASNFGLTEISIPEGITVIESETFLGTNITNVDLPLSLKTISSFAFNCCDRLETVHYAGSAEQWAEIEIGDHNDHLVNAEIIFAGSGEAPEETELSGICGENVEWNLNKDGILTIYGSGAMYDYDYWEGDPAPWRYCSSKVKAAVVEYGITHIGSGAFEMCYAMNSIEIPESVTSIGNSAFRECEGLTSIILPSGMTSIGNHVFYYCRNLAEIVMPEGIQSIGAGAFMWCDSLTEIEIPASVMSIGDYAFDNCSGIESVHYAGSAEQWAQIAIGENNECLINANLIFGGDSGDSKVGETVLVCAFNQSITNPEAQALLWMSDAIYDATEGRYSIKVYPDAELGDQASTLEMVSRGELDMAVVANTILETYCPDFAILGTPYVFDSLDHQAQVFMSGALAELAAQTQSKGFETATAFTMGTRNIYTRDKAIVTPADLEGLKIRALGTETCLEMIGAMGGTGIAMPMGDVYSAIMMGVIDGAENNIISYTDLVQYEVAPYYNLTGHLMVPDELCISDSVLANMSDADREAIQAICAEAGAYEYELVKQLIADYESELRNLGVVITQADIGAFRRSCMDIIRAAASASSGTMSAYNAIREYGEYSDYVFEITSQPQDLSAEVGQSVVFSVKAEGEGLTYQWQYSVDGGKTWYNNTTGTCKTDSYTVTAKLANNGRQYRCVVTDANGTVLTSTAAVLTVTKPPVSLEITAQPVSVTVETGAPVVFTVKASGDGLSYQWQYSVDGGETWYNNTTGGYNTNTYSTTAKAANNGRLFRCVVSDINQNVLTSDPAKLTVVKPAVSLAITAQPVSVTAEIGAPAVFTVKAEGEGLTYRWQYSVDGETWYNCSTGGYNTDTFSTTVKAANNGRQYRCVVTDINKNVITSNVVMITVKAAEVKPAITSQPVSVTGEIGAPAVFTVKAQGNGLTYQWQYSINGGETWYNNTTGGYNTDTFSTTIKAANNGRQYRCVVTDINKNAIISDVAMITVKAAAAGFAFTAQPESASAAIGDNVVFSVKAQGDGLAYRWQYSIDGGETWYNATTGTCRTDSFTVTVKESNVGRMYRCTVTESDGTVHNSDPAQLTLK